MIKFSKDNKHIMSATKNTKIADIPEGVIDIEPFAFDEVKLEEAIFPESLERIKNHAFTSTKLQKLEIKHNIILEDCCFYNNDCLDKIYVNTEKVPKQCFCFCGRSVESDGIKPAATDIKLVNTKVIGENAFYRSYIGSLNLPDTLKELEDRSFYWAKFCNPVLVLPAGLEKIGDEAFDCEGLTDIYLPNSLVSLGDVCCEGVRLHMSDFLLKKLHLLENKYIIVESIDKMLQNMSFREANDKALEIERIRNQCLE